MAKYRLYFDESGVHSTTNVASIHQRYLALCGLIFREDDYVRFQLRWEKMKRSFFSGDPDIPVIIHRKEIMARSGAFSVLADEQKRAEFDAGFLRIVSETPFTSIIVVIDKASHRDNQSSPLNPYHYCLVALIKSYCYWLGSRCGDVMGESRGKTEDQELKATYSALYSSGSWDQSPKFYQTHLTSKDIKLFPKNKNIAGLQLADLLAHPAKMRCLISHGVDGAKESSYGSKVANMFWTKLRKSPDENTKGYGEIYI